MGEEKKEEEKKKEKKEEDDAEIVLKVDMHCEACARKVAKVLKGFEGVEEVRADSKGNKVVVKGKEADPIKVCERLKKKSGRKVELISPLPKPPHENKKPEQEEEEDAKKNPPLQAQEKKDEPPAVVRVVLKVHMHCEACAHGLRKRIRKIPGVESVETDMGNDEVIVKGVIDPEKLVDHVYKTTRKQASIVKDKEKKEEEEKKEEKEMKEEKQKEEEEEDDNKGGIQRFEYWPSNDYIPDYAYNAPEFFSDDNPNACSVM